MLDLVGNTPCVRVSRMAASLGVKCELVAKLEYVNPGGSVKDCIAKQMVSDVESSGRLKKGDMLVAPTSGNTGIGIALAAAVKGYNRVLTLPEKMSKEKVCTIQALGSQVIRTPTEARERES